MLPMTLKEETLLDKILEMGGQGFIIPAVLSVLVLYATRGLFGLHGRRSQNRKDFLELWDSARSQDDFWLEVVVKHLIGVYLPAHVIRLALAQPNRSDALFELAELWPLWRYRPDAEKVEWLNRHHQAISKRKAIRKIIFLAYFACAGIAVCAAVAGAYFGHGTFSGWVYGAFAVIMAVAAIGCVLRDDTMRIAVEVGDEWVDRINRSASPSRIRSRGDNRDKGAVPH